MSPSNSRLIYEIANIHQGTGTCQNLSNCKGVAYPGYCPKGRFLSPYEPGRQLRTSADAAGVQCCLNTQCSTPDGSGLCRHKDQGCSAGKFVAGHCPGDNSVQCCVEVCKDPKPDTCNFYADCLEKQTNCGPDGYPIGYGKKYCEKFAAARQKMTAASQAWLSKTMLCLQRKLVPYATGDQKTTCASLRTIAYDSHPSCYVSGGVCLLSPSEWKVIIETVGLKEIFGSLDALKQTLKTAAECAALYAYLMELGTWPI